jgi:hypothetical protein
MRGMGGFGFEGFGNNFLNLGVGDCAGRARSGFIGQTRQALVLKPFAPFTHGLIGNLQALSDLAVVQSFGAGKYNARTGRESLLGCRPARPRFEFVTLIVGQYNGFPARLIGHSQVSFLSDLTYDGYVLN